MFDVSRDSVSVQINRWQKHFREAPALPFSDLLSAAEVQPVLGALEVTFRERVFDPVVTLWAFLSQVFSFDHSCRETVARVLAWRVSRGEQPCSAQTGSYCQARKRLPEALPAALARRIGQEMERRAEAGWLWKERHHVKIVDGSTVLMPDTPANQESFPQSAGQKPGLGFPIARLVVVFSLACGAALELAMGPCRGKRTGENTLFRRIMDALEPNDVVLGDAVFESYQDLAMLKQRGIEAVFRKHGTRRCDFRRGTWLGTKDHVVTWSKPAFGSARFDRQAYDQLPERLVIRELAFDVHQPGFRSKQIVLVTTLLDAEVYPAEELAALYRERWHCELDLNALKTTLQMDMLRCKTPPMVRKEVWVHLLVYNLIRRLIAESAREFGQLPRRLSFKGALQTIGSFAPYLAIYRANRRAALTVQLLHAIASHHAGERPDRIEPRAIKRRPKYSYLTLPRRLAKQRLTA